MRQTEPAQIAQQLQDVPDGSLTILRHAPANQNAILLSDQFSAKTAGKGKLEVYPVFPGMNVSYHLLLASEITFHHIASPSVLELFYCHSGRAGWNMQGGTAIYLGAGDLAVHSAACCADSTMMLPLGYTEGISVSVDLSVLETTCPEILQEAGLNAAQLQLLFCSGPPLAIPACQALDWIFLPLYAVPPARRSAYLPLKVQELLLALADLRPDRPVLTQYVSWQTERIKEIHRQLTEHLEHRFTIESLSKQYLINTSTLKEVFKAVYGLPIATYMKEYRMAQAMKLLRETPLPISEIANRVGYETQGKFSKAFKETAQMSPSEYRRKHAPTPAH